MLANSSIRFFSVVVLLCWVASEASGQGFIVRKRVKVRAEATIDWRIAISGKSNPDLGEIVGYKATAQTYDYYGPVRASRPMPLVLFVSYRSTPMGYDYLGKFCQQNGIVFVEPWKVGNSVEPSERIRIALDCFDDVRQRIPIDPDRTYVAGYSGGATVAKIIGMNLSEYFGGVLTANTSYGPPTNKWALDRCRSRLSFAMIVGEKEAAGFEMSQVQCPIFESLGIRARCHVIPGAGHAAAPPASFVSALQWLEAGVAARRQVAAERPVLRISGNLTREVWASAALKDCEELLEDDDTIHVGLGLLRELAARWPDLPAAAEAMALLDDYEGRDPRPWVEAAKRERLDGTRVLATTYDQAAFSKGTLAKTPRAVYAQAAIRNYGVLVEEESDPKFVDEAKSRIEALQVIADKMPKQPLHKMDDRRAQGAGKQDNASVLDVRFSHEGPFILRDLLDYLRVELRKREVELQVDEEAIDRAALSLDVRVPLKFDEEQLRDILRFALPKAGLEYRFLGSSIRITAAKRSDSPK